MEARNPDIWSSINNQQQLTECVMFDGINREHLCIAAILQSGRVDSEDGGIAGTVKFVVLETAMNALNRIVPAARIADLFVQSGSDS